MGTTRFFDLDIGQEGGNKEFWYQRFTKTEAQITGDHKHPNGDVGPVLFDPLNGNSKDTGKSIIGNTYNTTTNSGKEVAWKILKFSSINRQPTITIERTIITSGKK